MKEQSTEALEIFYSYASEDDELRNQLDKHLSTLRKQGLIVVWHSRLISAGAEWAKEVDAHLNTAHIILLLISPDFLSSKSVFWNAQGADRRAHLVRPIHRLLVPITAPEQERICSPLLSSNANRIRLVVYSRDE